MNKTLSQGDIVDDLAEEFVARYRNGERPSLSEFAARCPERADEIRELFPALIVMEQAAQPGTDEPPTSVPDEQPLTVRQLGDFRIIREVGRGGMGVVYEAEQVSLGRRVALKVLTNQVLIDSKHKQRFEREARAAARLHHTNIVPVFGVGQQDDLHYYVMQFIHGLGLDEVLVELKRLREHSTPASGGRKPTDSAPVGVQASACVRQPEGWTPTRNDASAVGVAQSLLSGQFERTLLVDSGSEATDQPLSAALDPTAVAHLSDTFPLPGQSEHFSKSHTHTAYWQSVARIGVQAAEALQHAHDQGIIHRDVKPGNLLLDTRGCVWVTDFGLAKATDQQDLTHTGDVLGTLRYMAPEQFDGQADGRSDVYSLGLTLYELLALRPAFDETERHRLVKQVTTGAPARLRALDRTVPRDLETIVHKAIEREPGQRYQTAEELAADLRRYLGDEPIHARRPPVVQRLSKWALRHRPVVVTACVGLLVAVSLLAASTVRIAREQRLTATALQAETRAKEDLKQDSYFHRISLAHRDLSTDNLGRALKLLEQCPQDLREWEWHYLMRLCRVEPLVLWDNAEINGLAFAPDGDRLASAGGDGAVKFWNSRTGDAVQTIAKAHAKAVVGVAFDSGGQYLASVGADRRVKVWDLTTEQELFNAPCDATRKFGTAYTVAFSPDGRKLAAASEGAVTVWDWKNRQLLHTLPGHGSVPIPVAFSHDGRCLATGTAREGLKLWDPETGLLLRTIPAHRHPVSALAFSPNGEWIASGSFDRTVKLSDSKTGELLHNLEHPGLVMGVAFSPDGRRLASAGEDRTVRVCDATTGREVLALRGHADRCGCVAFSRDGVLLASASTDGTIRIWNATPLRGDEGQEIMTFTRHSDEIRSVEFSPNDSRGIASAGMDGLVRVWDAQTGRVNVSFSDHTLVVFCVGWHPDGEHIASAGFDGTLHTVKVWDARTGRVVVTIPTEQEKLDVPYSALAFSPDGRHLVTGKVNGDVQVWDAGTGREVQTLGSHGGEVRGVAFSGKGGRLATASSDGVVKLWDATSLDKRQNGRLLTDRARVPGPNLNVAFSPDGRRLATGGEDNTVRIWDVETGSELRTLRGHTGEVYALAFSPGDGRWVASGGGDSTVKVWDSHSEALVYSFRGHTGIVSSVAFSPDGRRLVSGSRDKTVKIWDVTPAHPTSEVRP